jgi:hypothetical protein
MDISFPKFDDTGSQVVVNQRDLLSLLISDGGTTVQ